MVEVKHHRCVILDKCHVVALNVNRRQEVLFLHKKPASVEGVRRSFSIKFNKLRFTETKEISIKCNKTNVNNMKSDTIIIVKYHLELISPSYH